MDTEILLGDILSLLSSGYGFSYVNLIDADTGEDVLGYPIRVTESDRYIRHGYLVVAIAPDDVGGSLKLSVIENY